MPIPIQTTPTVVTPNSLRYDLSISTRCSEGRLIASAGVVVHPTYCDENDVWTDAYAPSASMMIPDIEEYAAQHPEVATLISNVWTALNSLVHAINSQDKLL